MVLMLEGRSLPAIWPRGAVHGPDVGGQVSSCFTVSPRGADHGADAGGQVSSCCRAQGRCPCPDVGGTEVVL